MARVASKRNSKPVFKHHIDKRAAAIASSVSDDDDALMSTNELAAWLGVSPQWIEIGRHKGYGPKFEQLAPKIIRYRKSRVKTWLDSRSRACTSEYQR
jgi:hypothetical protein